jgi:UDP-2,4-diacetamido-2,4,6-trideoxy-beta-L-altropyranose hydrolase
VAHSDLGIIHIIPPIVAAPLLIIIADGGPRIGFGHVGRCLAVWEEMDRRAAFAVEDPDIVRALDALGAPVVAPGARAPVVLLDRRAPTGVEEVARMQAEGRRVCLLDDPGEGRANADLVVDPPIGPILPPSGGRRLAGFEHVLLRRDVRAAAQRPLGGVDVLLSMGGSDPECLTPVLAGALRAAGVSVLSVLGPAYRGPRPAGEVLVERGDWPRALAGARLLVARFGHTLLEAAYLGTPALAIATGRRAVEAAAFTAHGTAEALRIEGPADARRVAGRTLSLREDPVRLAELASRGRGLLDGRGAMRVAAALGELA